MSRLYQELSKNVLEQLIYQYFGEIDFTAEVLKGGMFNTTYLLETSDDKFVLRLGPIHQELLLPFEENLMAAEKFVYEQFKKSEIPTSELVICDESKAYINRDVMIVRYIPSQVLSENESSHYYEQVGKLTAKMHQIKSKKFGRISQILRGKSYDKWSEYLQNECADVSRALLRYELFSTEEVSEIVKCFEKYQVLLNEIKSPCLVHADLWSGNVLVDKQEVVAIIDADRAIFGDKDFEFAGGWLINDDFLCGYGENLGQSQAAEIRRMLYQILQGMIDAYVWSIEYENSEEGNKTKQMVLEKLKGLEKINA